MIEQIPESDLGLAYQFLRRLTGRPSIPVTVPLQVEEFNAIIIASYAVV
jgi:hypothetical protein